MKTSDILLCKAETDLGINTHFTKGERIPVANCWHFCTDGNAIDSLFYDDQDFIDGMNRICIVIDRYSNVAMLAFVLMDTHLHFILYGQYDECSQFVHEYLRRTSIHISRRHHLSKKLKDIPVNCQHIDNDFYLKTAICYVIKNPTAAGLPFIPLDYPWSSGSLYFRNRGLWTSAKWSEENAFSGSLKNMSRRKRLINFKTKALENSDLMSCGSLIFPGEYVEFKVVERLSKTHGSYTYFMNISKEEDLNPLAFIASRLSIPIREMRQLRNSVTQELFGATSIHSLDLIQRIQTARTLRSRYKCSAKQVARVCGLIYDEVKDSV